MTSFENNIKKWVNTDNKIKSLLAEVKQLREEKNNTTIKIFNYIEENNLSHATIKISNGTLRFTNYNQGSPLTFKHIRSCLDRCINDKDKIEYILDYIKSTRETKLVKDIKRSYN